MRTVTQVSGAVPTAAPVIVDVLDEGAPLTVTAVPGAGGTLLVEHSTSSRSEVGAGTATWIAWSHGAVASAISDTLLSPVTALRFTATTAAGVYEVVA